MAKLTLQTEIGPIALVGGLSGLEKIHLTPIDSVVSGQLIHKESTLAQLEAGYLPEGTTEDIEFLKEAGRQIREYLAGARKHFDLKLNPEGTEFQKSVWQSLQNIPFGKTLSYSDQAKSLGDLKKVRAVAQANGRNPLPIVIPCHRVIGKDGSLTGFSAGLEIKKVLLNLEKRKASLLQSNTYFFKAPKG